MVKKSAGLLMYRQYNGELQVLLVHPGGPYWAKKDWRAWSIPKGEIDPGEDGLMAAQREFEEETSIRPEGNFLPLASVRQSSGKIVMAWAFEGDCEAEAIASNTFEMEWPPRSGQMQRFPELDRAAWFPMEEARQRIIKAQAEFLNSLEAWFQSELSDQPQPTDA
ncbi:NUDIX hydrolase [filamentous cyanobacterium CCP5]|nr:NUDIX hydrolase [filamentous cyanobacterium CCP5]